MLRIVQNRSPARAAAYFSSADYYSQGQELLGRWGGRGAARLGLSGTVEKADWEALCHNRDPKSGQPLTARLKDGRRVGYDLNFHVPKGLSLLAALTGDGRLVEAFRLSVDETMAELEAEVQTRVRRGGRDTDRTTGNLVWGAFVHTTSRPVDGVPDPHLHAHCFAFNATYDGEEGRWKALQLGGVKRDAGYFEAAFHARLARRVEELGVETVRTRDGWDVAGLGRATLDKFSRRTQLIEAAAAAKGIVDPAAKAELGAKTRERKQKQLSVDELRQTWRDRLTTAEQADVHRVAGTIGAAARPVDPLRGAEAVALAVDHCFERSSVVPERTVLATALKRALGRSSLAAVTDAFRRSGLITGERDGRRVATTRGVLAEETRMLDFARDGRGTCQPLGSAEHRFRDGRLNAGQRRAVLHVLTTPDRVAVIRGAAGVGKTTLMVEAVAAVEAGGTRVFTFAPSADASRGVLRGEGFSSADTVARLLVDPKVQEGARGQVLWVDEAGLLGTRTMARLFDLAGKIDARVILSGDRRQHGSVERGAALRLLETEAGVVPVEVKEIQRQSGAYKQAVAALAEGRTADGFRQLDQLGWIKEVADDGERYARLSADYVARTGADGPTAALVVSPTHREGEAITERIRSDLKRLGRLGSDERAVAVLTPAHLTRAERADAAVSLSPGDVLVYHRDRGGHRRGERVVVGTGPLPPAAEADCFTAYRPAQVRLAAGDVVRVTANGKTADGRHRLNNGATYAVAGFTATGEVRLDNGWVVPQSFPFLSLGYVSTSHASQGKSVRHVLVGQSAASAGAGSAQQWYVSASRGKQSLTVYTDEKARLLAAVSRLDERTTATELVSGGQQHQAAYRRRALTLHRLRQLRVSRLTPVYRLPDRTPDRREQAHER